MRPRPRLDAIRLPAVDLPPGCEPLPRASRRLKRAFDLGVGGILALVLVPVFAGIAAAIVVEGWLRRESRGRILYAEPRVSEGRLFGLFKFRTLHEEIVREYGDRRGDIKRAERPEHLTRVGARLKRYYLDELPQLFNVLSGDMTLVGPRPFPLEDYRREIAQGILRHIREQGAQNI